MAQPNYLKLLSQIYQDKFTPADADMAMAQSGYQEDPMMSVARQPAGEPSEYVPTQAGPMPMSPSTDTEDPERAALLAQLQAQDAQDRAARQKAIEYGQGSVNELEAALKAPQDRRVDLSPLLALTDTWFGGNLQKGYQAPPSPEELRQLQNKNLMALANEKQKLAELMSRGGSGNGLLGKIALMRDKDRGTQGRSDRAYDLKTKEGLFTRFQGDKVASSAKDALAGAANARELLRSGTPVGDRGFVVALARAAGERGPLSETDVNTWAGSPAIAARINRKLERLATGRLDEDDRADMETIIDIMEKRQRATLNNRIKYFSENVGPKVYGIDKDSAVGILGSDESVIEQSAPLQQTQLQKQQGTMSFEDWKKGKNATKQ